MIISTLELVRDAYLETGLLPQIINIIPHGGRCCAIGVLRALAEKQSRSCPLLYDNEYALSRLSFACGFDNGFRGVPDFQAYTVYSEGYKIGVEIRKLDEQGFFLPAFKEGPNDRVL